MRLKLIIFTLIFASLSWVNAAPLQAPISVVPSKPVAPKTSMTVPLAKLMTIDQPLILRGARARFELNLPISSRYVVHNVVLHVEYTSSISMLDERSQLRVSFNDQVLAQFPLRQEQPEGQFDVVIPDAMIKPGYNKIAFDAAQHYTLKCEDPSAPELWTQIDSVNSRISFIQDLGPVSSSLAMLSQTFDAKLRVPWHVNIVTGASPTDPQILEGSIIAQAVTMRMPYATVSFSQSTDPVAGSDNIFVGTAEQLETVLPGQLPHPTGYLEIIPSADPHYLSMVVSGAGDSDVTLAAKALAQLTFPLPDSNVLDVTSVDLTASSLVLQEGTVHPLSDLDYATYSVKGMNSEAFHFDLNLPADLYANERSQVELSLNFAYGAEMRTDSVVNIKLNNQFATAIALNDPHGGTFQAYKIYIPLRSFKPGHNYLTLEPHMVPLVTDFCAAIQEENLLFVLFDDSTISIPSASHYTAVPDLSLFSQSGFPLLTSRTTDAFSLYLSRPDSGTIAAAWTVMGKLGQKAGQVLIPGTVSSQTIRGSGSILAVGVAGTLDPTLADGSPVRFGPNGAIGDKGTAVGDLTGNVLVGDRPLLTSFISPFDHDGVVFLLTARTPQILEHRARDLVVPEVWDLLKGDTAVWTDAPDSLATTTFSTHFPIGSVDLSTSLDYYFSNYPGVLGSVFVAILMLLVVLSRKLLKKRQSKQH